MMIDHLTDIQVRILKAGKCHCDGWSPPHLRTAISGLVALEYIKLTFKGGNHETQYTSYDYDITDQGRQALIIHDTAPSA